jgi:UDP-N-acetyl-alpha-D-quinovosamine dehydrogenase
VIKALVTGANGFIGKALCERLLAEGGQVLGTVRSSDSFASLHSGVNGLKISSIDDKTDWTNALIGVDMIVHLAACVHVINHTAGALSVLQLVNVNGTERLAREAALANVRRFIYMSSVKVNGEGRATSYTEKDKPEPMDPYAASKCESEKILHAIAHETGLEVVIIRSPLVYGPRVKANFLRLFELVKSGIPLPLSSVNNRRSLIYIGNLVDAIVTCMKNDRASGQTYFVSDGDDVSTPELIRRMGYALGRPVRLFPFPSVLLKMAGIITGKSVAIDRLLSSLMVKCSKIRRELDWKAPFTMEQGLKETAKWYLKRKNISRKGAKTLR